MAINKVIYGSVVLLDTSEVTVDADSLVEGRTALNAKGELIEGANPYEKTATDAEVSTQSDLIADIMAALEGKAGNGEGIVPAGTIQITENGTYDVTEYAEAVINVPSKEPVLQEKTVNENGEVTPDEGYDGLSKVIVNVQSSGESSDIAICGLFIPEENYISSDQYIEIDVGFHPSSVMAYRKNWASGTPSINATATTENFVFSVCNTAGAGKANEKLVGSSYITLTETGFQIHGDSTYYLVGGAEYHYVAFR